MNTPSSNDWFKKAFKNWLLTFSISLSISLPLPLPLSFAQDGSDSIQLPSLHSDDEKLAVLLQIKEKVPNLFSDSIKYDIDLFALLEDEEKLLNLLKSNPEYLELFRQKKYHKIQITPPAGGLEIGELSIDPVAIQKWKELLKKTLHQFKTQLGISHENANLMEILRTEMTSKVRSITEANPSLDGNALLRELAGTKANQAILNPASNGIKTLSGRLSKALEVYIKLPNKPSQAFQENLEEALKLEQDREDLKSLIELHSALDRRAQNEDPTHQSRQTAEALINNLDAQDLTALQNKENSLSPLIHHLIPSSPPQLQEDILNRIHKTISSFASQTVRSEQKAKDRVTISQQHPIVGIFRGCAGGDCSSRLSFSYPNDPNEKVFFILDKNEKVKGYVNATQVMANNKPSLYVITISGNRVTSADTELILRGLEKEKEHLGAEQILLPTPNKIGNLMNFPAPVSVYKRYTVDQPTVEIRYIHPEIRNDIQHYESPLGYNRGTYDHMDQNHHAVVLNFKSNSGNETITTELHELSTASLQAPSLKPISRSEVIEFLLDLKRSGRQELEKKVLRTNIVRQSLNLLKYQGFTRLLFEGPSKEPTTVQQFKTLLKEKLLDLDPSLSDYLKKNPNLVYPAILSCTDAFFPENIEETAEYTIKNFKANHWSFKFDNSKWVTQINEHLLELNHSKHFQTFTKEILHHLQDTNPDVRKNALDCFGKIKPTDVNIHSEILQLALQDVDGTIKMKAFEALEAIKPRDPKIHLRISEALQDLDPNSKIYALKLLATIKPSDPRIHLRILDTLQDSDFSIRLQALDALKEIKVSDRNTQLRILEIALRDPSLSVRSGSLFVLGKFFPSYPEIYFGISQIARHDPNQNVRLEALRGLRSIELNPSIHLEILQVALHDQSERNRKFALESLKIIKSPHPEVNLGLLQVAIHQKDLQERALAIQALEGIDLSNQVTHESLMAELLKNLNQLKNRQDLLPIIQKIMLPTSLPAKTNETHCQSSNDLLSDHKNLNSLIDFLANHSEVLGVPVSPSFLKGTDENLDHPPIPPTTTKTHINPPPAPMR